MLDHVAGAREGARLAVVIDVFRAFSLAPHAFDMGVRRLFPVGEVDDAFELRGAFPGAVLAGERHARRLPGFDAGNSPTEIRALDLRGKTLVHTTHAGTQGLVHACQADEVLTGAFVNISAVCRYLKTRAAAQVSLVRMGHEARERCAEDDLYAECLGKLLRDRPAPLAEVRERLREAPAARKFFDPACDWAPREDFDYCTEVDRFDFVLRLRTRTRRAARARATRVARRVELGVAPVEFVLFGVTLACVALFHDRTLEVAAGGLAAIVAYKLALTGFHDAPGFAGLARHIEAEWVILANLFCLLMGFALLSRHFEASGVPDRLPDLLPDDWRGGLVLLVLVFVLSSFLDNIAAALIGGTVAASVYQRKVHVGYLAAIVAASNAGGSGSVVGDTTTTMMWIDGVSPRDVVHAYVAAAAALLVFGIPASLQQQRYSPIVRRADARVRTDWLRVGVVGFDPRGRRRGQRHRQRRVPGACRAVPVHRRVGLGGAARRDAAARAGLDGVAGHAQGHACSCSAWCSRPRSCRSRNCPRRPGRRRSASVSSPRCSTTSRSPSSRWSRAAMTGACSRTRSDSAAR